MFARKKEDLINSCIECMKGGVGLVYHKPICYYCDLYGVDKLIGPRPHFWILFLTPPIIIYLYKELENDKYRIKKYYVCFS